MRPSTRRSYALDVLLPFAAHYATRQHQNTTQQCNAHRLWSCGQRRAGTKIHFGPSAESQGYEFVDGVRSRQRRYEPARVTIKRAGSRNRGSLNRICIRARASSQRVGRVTATLEAQSIGSIANDDRAPNVAQKSDTRRRRRAREAIRRDVNCDRLGNRRVV